MERRARILSIATALLALAATHGRASGVSRQSVEKASAPPSLPDTLRLRQVAQSYADEKRFMGTVLVARGNDILLDQAYGFANLEWEVPNTPASKFRIGSITKQFTAASILLLEQRGKLRTSDAVKKYLPDAPASWEQITLYHLLTHTSGVPNYTSFPDWDTLENLRTTPDKLVALFRDRPLDFAPGEKWNYSNSGYVLLGYLLEKITGQSYAQFLEENILAPLGMKDSGYDSNSAIIPHRAAGYSPSPGGPSNSAFVDMSTPFSAGALYSTTGDLLRWEQGLFGGKILAPAELEKMITPFKNHYACGLNVNTINGHKVISHGGGINGFNTFLAYYPDDQLTVVVLANLNGGAPGQMALQLASVAHGEKVVLNSERKQVAVDPKVFDALVGKYQLDEKFFLTVTREGDRYFIQGTNQPKGEVFAESDHQYFSKTVDAQFTFVTDSAGRATELILHQAGTEQHAKRVE